MSYTHDYTDRFAALSIDLTEEEAKAEARVAISELEQAVGFLFALSAQGGPSDEGDMQRWQQEAAKLLEVLALLDEFEADPQPFNHSS